MKFRRFYRRGLFVGTILTIIFLLGPNFAPLNAAAASPADGWTRLSDPVAVGGVITNLVAAPSNPDILYVLQKVPVISTVTQRLYRSQDGGVTWQMVPAGNHAFTSLAVDPEDPDTLYATENNQLWKSTDTGLNWSVLYLFGEKVLVPAPGRIYLTGTIINWDNPCPLIPQFVRSLDGGLTWERRSFSCGNMIHQIFVAPGNPDKIFLSFVAQDVDTLYSLDGGTTWQPFLVNAGSFPIDNMAFDPQDPDRLFLVNHEMLTTDDNGESWIECGPIPEFYPLDLVTVSDRVYAIPRHNRSTTDPYLHFYQSEDHCVTWWKSIQGFPTIVNGMIGNANAPGKLLAATNGYGIFISTSGGAVWEESNAGLDSPAVISKLAIAPSDPNVILAGSGNPRPGVYRSADGGATWSPALIEIEPLSVLIHPLDPQIAWIGAKDGLYISQDGSHWCMPRTPGHTPGPR